MNEKILIVDDDPSTLDMIQIMLEAQDYEVVNSYDGMNALEKIRQENFDLVITDLKMPRMNGIELLKEIKSNCPGVEVIVTTAYMTIETAISAMKIGAYDYLTKPIEDLERARMVIERAIEKGHMRSENRNLRNQLNDNSVFCGMLGKSKPMCDMYELIEKVSTSDSTVLIQGECGTGKELVASAVHKMSSRKDKRIIPIDCGSVPLELLESELFGHVKGSFTGAVSDKVGLFEEAHGGTLFLDEISSTDLSFQMKLLRALQEKEIRRVGGTKRIKIDIRLVVASNKDLKKEVEEGRFRQDLYYRINIVTIYVPSLRDRKEDIPLLSNYFLAKFSKISNKYVDKISDEVIQIFSQYAWPGNVRELENVIERAIILTNSNEIIKNDLPPEIISYELAHMMPLKSELGFNEAKELFEKNYIVQILRENKGNISVAAKKSGLLRQSLQSKIKKYDIDPTLFRS